MRFLYLIVSLLALPVAASDCETFWQQQLDDYQAGRLELAAFIDSWRQQAESCAGNGDYELNLVRLLTSDGRFGEAAVIAKEASLLPGIAPGNKLNLLMAYLDNQYYLPASVAGIEDPLYWAEALKPYRDLMAIGSASDLLFWRLIEMNFLAGSSTIAYEQGLAYLGESSEGSYRAEVQRLLVRVCAALAKNGEAVYRFRQLAAEDDAVWQHADVVLSAVIAANHAHQRQQAARWLQQGLEYNAAIAAHALYPQAMAQVQPASSSQ
ncbi:MAG TPA: hypothetical protein VIN71_00460 [Pseudomonadales bacterium]